MCSPGPCTKYTKPADYNWSKRHEMLQHLMEAPKFRQDMVRTWHDGTSTRFAFPFEMVNGKAVPIDIDTMTPGGNSGLGANALAQFDWQIEIGRALLDYPELDRDMILERVRRLEKVRKVV